MAGGEALKSNYLGLRLQSMINKKTKAPQRRDPSNRKLLHIQGGQVVGLDLSREASDARIRSITRPESKN